MHAWTGKLLRVDLTAGSVAVEEIPRTRLQNYLGGRGLAVRYLMDEIDPQLEPLSPEEPAAKALSYVDDAAQSDSPQRGSDQFCSNCNLVRSESGSRRQCAIFPGKSVSENGWCSAWVKKS